MSKDPIGRALELLSLLQTHRFWPSPELAERLTVTERTVRRDVDRLRELGYPVDAISGRHGGYRLASGSHLPPLVLDDEEAVAVAVGLRHSAAAAIEGMEETALRALMKIEPLLPHRLRRRVSALYGGVSTVRWAQQRGIAAETLTTLAAACRDREQLRLEYRSADGERSTRVVEPHQLVTAGRRWYLVAWDTGRDDWRTLRLDRIAETHVSTVRFTVREIPGGDAAALVARLVGAAPRDQEGILRVRVPYEVLDPVVRWYDHDLLESAADHCLLRIRGEDIGRLALVVARIALAAPVSVREPTDLIEAVETLALNLGKTESSSPARESASLRMADIASKEKP